MLKLVIIKFWDGSFEQGFPATLQIGEDGLRPTVEIAGKLPPAPELPLHYRRWQVAYRRLGLNARLEAKTGFVTNVSKIEDCGKAAQILRDRLNQWLQSESFLPIREKLLEQLQPSDTIRIVLQTEDIQLQRLPWHLWNLFERYSKAEIALSAPAYEKIERPLSTKNQVNILAILGNSTGIDIQADRALLKQLPHSEIAFLVEPQRQELNEQLWKQDWDILFFAGHSSSQVEGETGYIHINQIDNLTIEQIKYALKKAVERGLKIAIFNSCDGLGLARDLAELQIPLIILMREPVPDKVAQEFLKYFLEAFSQGETFYLSVREAREKLQGLEDKFPCASWLPFIYQNPAELPPTWNALYQPIQEVSRQKSSVNFLRPNWRTLLLASVACTAMIMGVRYLGFLQPLELQAFDQLLRQRPQENIDPRLIIVTITEADIQAQKPEQRRGSLSDEALNQLLQKLEQYQPRVIGLDIYRDFPVQPKQKDLALRLQKNQRLISICKVSDPEVEEPGIKPPPEIPIERLGFSDFIVDADGIVRRHLLAMTPDPASPCIAPYAFSVQVAFRYLAAENISPQTSPEGFLQLNSVIFKPWESHQGGYQGIDAWGHQILLNYRSYRSLNNIAAQVTLADVLNGRINPNSIKDRIVLIGTTANSFPDDWFTPYSKNRLPENETHGVIIQAQMVSQILSAVLDKRPLLWVLPVWGEAFWIGCWSFAGGFLALNLKSPFNLGTALIASYIVLYGICFSILTYRACWLPLVPSAITLVATSATIVTLSTFKSQKNLSKSNYELEKMSSTTD